MLEYDDDYYLEEDKISVYHRKGFSNPNVPTKDAECIDQNDLDVNVNIGGIVINQSRARVVEDKKSKDSLEEEKLVEDDSLVEVTSVHSNSEIEERNLLLGPNLLYQDQLGMTVTSGVVTIKKDSSNLIGISIGGGAPLCPCLYIVQVFDNTPAAKEGTLQSGDELVGVNGNSVKGKTKVEVAKMIQACKDEVQIKYNKLHADPQRGKTLDIILKKVKHRLVENMSTTTADALGLSRAILCNDTLVQKLEELESTEAMYRGLVDHTKRVLKAFFGLILVYKDFGDAFAAIGVREPQPRASEAFSRFGDYHRQMEKFGIETLRAIKPILSDLGTYLNKAIPDTKLTIRKYADTKFEYLSYCLQVKEKDDEEYSYSALQEPLYRVETGNYEYRLILRCRQDARNRFARLRSDVSVKLELLGNKHVQDVVWQLHKLVAGLASFHAHTLQLLKDNALFPIEMDLSRSAFNYKSTSPIVNDEEEDDDDEILQPAEEALEETNNDLIEGVEPLNVNQDSTKESVPSFMEDLSSLTLSQDLLSDLQPTPVTSLTIQPITSVQSSTEENTPTATLIGFD